MQTRGGGEGIFSTVITGLNMLIKQADSVIKGHKRGRYKVLTLKVRCMAGFTTHVLSLFQPKICVMKKITNYKILYTAQAAFSGLSLRGDRPSPLQSTIAV